MTEQHEPPVAAPAEGDTETAQALARAQAEAEARHARELVAGRRLEAATARLLGKAADDGTGRCRWCGLTLGTDSEGNRTHPVRRECSGPPPEPCGICCRTWRWDVTTYHWVHDCGTGIVHGPTFARGQGQLERVRDVSDAQAELGGGLFGYRRGGDE